MEVNVKLLTFLLVICMWVPNFWTWRILLPGYLIASSFNVLETVRVFVFVVAILVMWRRSKLYIYL